MSIKRRAWVKPTRSVTNGAICAGGIPKLVSLRRNFASAVTSVTSATQARPKPPPMAAPSTKAITTCGCSLSLIMTSPKARLLLATSSASIVCIPDLNPLISPPAQNTPPLPLSTRVRIERSGAMASSTATNSSVISALSAFFASGRLNQTCNTEPCRCISNV